MTARSRLALWALHVLGALLLSACSPQVKTPRLDAELVTKEAKFQQALVLRDTVDKLDRLGRVAWAVRSSNAELCGAEVVHGLGLSFLELDDYKEERRELMREVLGIGWRPTVFQLPPGSPGFAAGLRRGDTLLQVGGTPVEKKKEAYALIKAAIAKGDEIALLVDRDGERLGFAFKAAPLCGYPVVLSKGQEINAYADGSKIVVTAGMMKFVRNDDELAGILGHELAHNTQRHSRDKSVNRTLGMFLVDLPVAVLTGINPNVGGQLGGMMFSQQYEREADYVGLYYTARAGFDLNAVPAIWRRMALEDPRQISMGSSHPSTSERFVGLDAGAKEIEAKRKAGLALWPGGQDAPVQLADKPAAGQPGTGEPKQGGLAAEVAVEVEE